MSPRNYKVIEEIAQLNHRGDSSLCLDKVQLDGGGIAYDLRIFYYRPFGEPGRGITLNGSDLRALYEALKEYYGKPEKAEPEVPLKNDNTF